MNWRPIETAPRDGTAVLVTDGEDCEVARNYGHGWFDSDGLDFAYGAWDAELTHWMPLPELPK